MTKKVCLMELEGLNSSKWERSSGVGLDGDRPKSVELGRETIRTHLAKVLEAEFDVPVLEERELFKGIDCPYELVSCKSS
jgi:hypothetical protein